MTINTEMFQKIYDQISQHPETHNQGSFESCGTTRCVAGWAIAFHYGTSSIYDVASIRMDLLTGWRERLSGAVSLGPEAIVARDILGLTNWQAFELFYSTTDEVQAVEACLRYATKGDEAG